MSTTHEPLPARAFADGLEITAVRGSSGMSMFMDSDSTERVVCTAEIRLFPVVEHFVVRCAPIEAGEHLGSRRQGATAGGGAVNDHDEADSPL